MISAKTKKQILGFQRNEITEHHIYMRLAARQKSQKNRKILEDMAADEKRHYHQWKQLTNTDVSPSWSKIYFWSAIAKILGFTFAVKLMEQGESNAQVVYSGLPEATEMAQAIAREENIHENALLNMLDEERLRYVGSIVLGLNDALVELTGALAGLSLAFQNTRMIAMTGSITGVAAALSMAASEYLSTKTEAAWQHPFKAAFYTGTAYIFTVVILIIPYLLLENYIKALICTLLLAVGIIAAFNYYIAVAKDQPFAKRFFEMAGLSLAVAGISFLVGYALRAMGIAEP